MPSWPLFVWRRIAGQLTGSAAPGTGSELEWGFLRDSQNRLKAGSCQDCWGCAQRAETIVAGWGRRRGACLGSAGYRPAARLHRLRAATPAFWV